MTAPTPATDAEKSANQAYLLEGMAAYQRWMKRSNWIIWPVVLGVMASTLFAMSKVTESGGLGIIMAFVAGFVAMFVVMTFVIPATNVPTLRCPYCAGRVPLIERPKPFTKYQWTRVCPSCSRDLPYL